MTECTCKIMEAAGIRTSFTNDQWLYTHRGPNKALDYAKAHKMIEGNTYWMDHLDTLKTGPRQWTYIAEPYRNLDTIEEDYQTHWDFLRSVGWKIRFAGKEESMWHRMHGTGTIHISLTKEDEEVLAALEAGFDKKLEEYKELLKQYGGKIEIEGDDRYVWAVRYERDQIKALKKLVRSA